MKLENVVAQIGIVKGNANIGRVRSLIESFNLVPFAQILKSKDNYSRNICRWADLTVCTYLAHVEWAHSWLFWTSSGPKDLGHCSAGHKGKQNGTIRGGQHG